VEPFAATDTLLKGAIDNVRDSLEKFRELQEAYLENLDREDIRARLAGGLWQPYFANVNGWQPQGPLWGSMPQKEFRQASGDISFKSHFLARLYPISAITGGMAEARKQGARYRNHRTL